MPVMMGTIFCCLLWRMVIGWAGRKGSAEVESTMGKKAYSFLLPEAYWSIIRSFIGSKMDEIYIKHDLIIIPTELDQAFCSPTILTRSS